MKGLFFLLVIFLVTSFTAEAQKPINPKGMNYLVAPKTNTIIYHDSVYSGGKQFEQLFYRTRDDRIIALFEKHRSNKTAGQVIGFVGTVATVIGIRKLSSSDGGKGAGWALIGGGLAATITGGYLTLMGQRNLAVAVTLFNQKNHQSALGIGVSGNTAGLVYNF